MRRKHFAVDITDEDEVDVWFDVDRVVAFSVNDRAVIGGQWCEVMRFDTAHGRLHVHRFWEPHPLHVLEREPATDYGAALRKVRQDVAENWRMYRARMEARR